MAIQADHAQPFDYERELSLSYERHQSFFRELEAKKQTLEAKDQALGQETTRITELEKRLADSEKNIHTLSETLVRYD